MAQRHPVKPVPVLWEPAFWDMSEYQAPTNALSCCTGQVGEYPRRSPQSRKVGSLGVSSLPFLTETSDTFPVRFRVNRVNSGRAGSAAAEPANCGGWWKLRAALGKGRPRFHLLPTRSSTTTATAHPRSRPLHSILTHTSSCTLMHSHTRPPHAPAQSDQKGRCGMAPSGFIPHPRHGR